MEGVEHTPITDKAVKLESTLKDLTERLDNSGIDYFIVGSLARNMYMGVEVQSPEIDIIIPNKKDRQRTSQIIEQEIQPSHPDITIDTSLSDFIVEDDGDYRLIYGNINFPVEKDLVEPETLNIGNTKFKTFSPPTLLHTYTFVGGPFREKDWKNSLTFARWMKNQNIHYDDTLYDNFHQFGKLRWKGSPLRKAQYGWRKIVNSLPKEFRRQLLSGIYEMPAAKRMRHLFNRLEENTCGIRGDSNEI